MVKFGTKEAFLGENQSRLRYLDYLNIFTNLIFTSAQMMSGYVGNAANIKTFATYSSIFKDLWTLFVGWVYEPAIPTVHLCFHFFINP